MQSLLYGFLTCHFVLAICCPFKPQDKILLSFPLSFSHSHHSSTGKASPLRVLLPEEVVADLDLDLDLLVGQQEADAVPLPKAENIKKIRRKLFRKPAQFHWYYFVCLLFVCGLLNFYRNKFLRITKDVLYAYRAYYCENSCRLCSLSYIISCKSVSQKYLFFFERKLSDF